MPQVDRPTYLSIPDLPDTPAREPERFARLQGEWMRTHYPDLWDLWEAWEGGEDE